MDKNINEVCQFLAETDDIRTIYKFLESILTEKEMKTLSSRWQIVKLLSKGVPQRKIANELHLSLCKITRGSKELKKRNSVLKKAVEKYL